MYVLKCPKHGWHQLADAKRNFDRLICLFFDCFITKSSNSVQPTKVIKSVLKINHASFSEASTALRVVARMVHQSLRVALKRLILLGHGQV